MKKVVLATDLARELYHSHKPFALVAWVKEHVSSRARYSDAQASYLIQLVNAYTNLVHKLGTRDVDKKHGAVEI